MRKRDKFVLFLLFIVVVVSAQTKYNLSIEDLFSLGMENSTQIKASRLNVGVYKEKEAIAKTGRLPNIEISAVNGIVGDPVILDKDLTYRTHSKIPNWKQNYGIEFSQPIYVGGRIKNTLKTASLESEIAQLDMEKDKASLKLVLINNYLQLFQLYKQKEVLKENITEAEKRLKDIRNLKKEGIVTNNDVLRSQIVLSNYQLSSEETMNNIMIISQQLDIFLGLNENYIIVPDTILLNKYLPLKSEEYYTRQGYEKFPELKISAFNIEKAKVDEKITKSKYLPKISLNAGNTLLRPITSSGPVQDLYMNSWTVTLGLSYDLSSWFDYKHTLNQMKYNISIQENIKEQTEQNIRMGVRSSYIRHKQALNRTRVLKNTVEQARENYRITKNKYFNQLAILTDLLDASSVLLDAELQQTTAKADYIYSYYQLLEASGNL